tara:strand:+ start:1205 stop:1681 length:477 start_codon:yes stop_codon:yes gene_type:complete
MVLAWLSNIWKSQKVDPQLFKFTKQFTYESNIENINTFFSKLSNYSYAKEAVNRVNQQRDFDLSFIDSEIKNLESITIPTPKFISYRRVGRKPQPWERVTSRYSNRRWWIENPEKKRIYQQQVAEFDIYKSDTLSRIASNLSFLGKQRDLIPSEPFSL